LIKGIDEVACIGCKLCDYVCQTDVFDSTDGAVKVKYPDDCYNCMECVFICPTDAIVFGPGVPRKFDIRSRWQQIKDALSREQVRGSDDSG
jgi:NAD-dependent dihydropyrimidine dehydrogenase PreA subunit